MHYGAFWWFINIFFKTLHTFTKKIGDDKCSKYGDDEDEDWGEEKAEGKGGEDWRDDGKESKRGGGESKGSAAAEKKISGKELIDRVQKYFYEDEEFTKTFENFVKAECEVIDLQSEEYKLAYTEVYERYKILFEDKLEAFIARQGCSSLDFYKALKEASDSDPESAHTVFGQILVAVVDFDIFMIMMREMAQSSSRAKRK